MAKKKPPEEHENLERWLVSYADFMTLLFATFVVLYALAQTDVNSFKNLEDALKRAFTQSLLDNQASIMQGTDSILQGQQGATNPLMLEYMSQKYEQTSYEEIKDGVEKLKQDGVSAEIDDRGLVIRLNEHALKFKPASAELEDNSFIILDKVAKIIKEKFSIHYIQVEGHSDSDPMTNNKIYPSNWELSSARASSVVRHLIKVHGFNPKIFIAVGLADTIPIVSNTTPVNKAKNRRVEIVILKNKNRFLSKKNIQEILKEAKFFQKKKGSLRDEQQELIKGDSELLKNSIDMTDRYENETKRLKELENNDFMHDGEMPDFLKENNKNDRK